MCIKAFITAEFSFGALSTVWAESLPVYFGTYTSRPENSSKGIYRSTLDLEMGKLSEQASVRQNNVKIIISAIRYVLCFFSISPTPSH